VSSLVLAPLVAQAAGEQVAHSSCGLYTGLGLESPRPHMAGFSFTMGRPYSSPATCLADTKAVRSGALVVDDRSQIVEVLARYLHATDSHNGHEAAALFAPNCVLSVYAAGNGSHSLVDEIMGVELVEYAITHFLPVPPSGMSSRRMSTDHVVTIKGDAALLRASFFIVTTGVSLTPALPSQSTPLNRRFGQIIQSGFFLMNLVKSKGVWKMTRFAVYNDILDPGMPAAYDPARGKIS
jgi:hypothetical protein